MSPASKESLRQKSPSVTTWEEYLQICGTNGAGLPDDSLPETLKAVLYSGIKSLYQRPPSSLKPSQKHDQKKKRL